MKKRILSILLICLMVISLIPSSVFAASFVGYTAISTPQQLVDMANNLSGKYYLTTDIDMTNVKWTVVGSEDTPFSGVFDGNGHAVKNLKISKSFATYNNIYVGMFGYLASYAKVKNLTLYDCDITAENAKASFSSEFLYTGAIAGNNSGNISDCHVTGTLDGDEVFGGIVGQNKGIITNCTSAVVINSQHRAGGIVGLNKKTVSGCSFSGEIFAEERVGGIAYRCDGGTVSGCYNTGKLYGKSHTAGIVGSTVNASTIEKCYNTGDIFSHGYAGGIAGYVGEKASIVNCYNEGNIGGNNYTDDCGGIAGYAYRVTLSQCYNIGNIAITKKSNNSQIDGIAGYSSSNTISDCFSSIATTVGTTCTLAELKNQKTYTGFDFDTVWKMSDDARYPLAVLQDTAHLPRQIGTQDFADGNGSIYAPFKITNKTQLNHIRKYPYSHFVLQNDIVFEKEDFTQGGAFYNEGTGFVPIGDNTLVFGGTLDGGSHKISGLYINTQNAYTGLFGYSVGTIKNITLENADISNTKTDETTYTAGVAGYVGDAAIIENCFVSGSISSAASYVGGIVGRVTSAAVQIRNCNNKADVTGRSYVGGIVGDTYTKILKAQNSGTIIGTNYTGGIAGYVYYNNITACTNDGKINGNSNVGGIVGLILHGTVSRCSNSASVTGTEVVGGIAGYVDYSEVLDSFNAYFVKGSKYIGGIAGRVYSSDITRCYNVAVVEGSTYFNSIGVLGDYSNLNDCLVLRSNETSTYENEYPLEQMKKAQTYVNYDFETVWKMSDSESYPFPIHRDYTFQEPKETTNEFAGGLGTAFSPYIIKNEQHFYNIRKHTRCYFVIAEDIEFSEAINPIGSFYGNIDGGGHTLKNVNITTDNTASAIGIFSNNYGNIERIHIKDALLSVTTNVMSPKAGILVGINSNTISDCTVSGLLTARGYMIDAGGIAGDNQGDIKNCINYAQIDSSWYGGGIAGHNAKSISLCINLGKVSTTEAMSAGIVAYSISGAVVTDCFNTGEIYSKESSAGIVTYNRGTIQNCYNIGTVRSSVSATGGICVNHQGTLKDCYHVNADDTSVYGTLCTLSQMKDAATFTGFDFERIWTMEGDANYPYPELRNLTFQSTLKGIEVYSAPTKRYYQCAVDELDLSGAKLTLFYDTCEEQIDITQEMVSGFSNETVGNCKINISYNGFTDYFYVYITCEHDWSTYYDDENHWSACYYCGETETAQPHTYDDACDTDCNSNCGYTRDISHDYKAAYDEDNHFDKCSVCDDAINTKPHEFDNACDTDCACGYEREITHNYNATYNAASHFEECTICGNIGFGEPHTFDNDCDTNCDCGYARKITHSYGQYVYNNDATAQKDGTKTRTCSICGDTETIIATGTMWKNPFIDVKKSDFYYESVLWAVNKGITSGTSKTTFSPNDACTRGQIAAFLWRAAGSPIPKGNKNPFQDVKKTDYYYNAVLWAVENGITSGTSSTTFSPNASCTRGQIVAFLWRANGSPAPKGSKNPFTDVKKSDFYYKAVLWAVENGITSGTSQTTFGPNSPCTRGQIATFLYRYYN